MINLAPGLFVWADTSIDRVSIPSMLLTGEKEYLGNRPIIRVVVKKSENRKDGTWWLVEDLEKKIGVFWRPEDKLFTKI